MNARPAGTSEAERRLADAREDGLRFLRRWRESLLEQVGTVRAKHRPDHQYLTRHLG